jgi:outer membrane protein OmpA-like peptidoglycan-associated protein
MNRHALHIAIAGAVLAALCVLTVAWVKAADKRFQAAAAAKAGKEQAAAVASASDEQYCSPPLKAILRRVLTSCGLVKKGEGAQASSRGCQPMEAKSVAAMSPTDFNALFVPMAHRAAIIQFDKDKADLDQGAMGLLDKTFTDQRGASYFLVVSRASPEGSVVHNRALSEKRAGAVLDHLKAKFNDPDLEKEVGLLWLGEEFAQLDKQFCAWSRSRDEACDAKALNRSAFVAWIDCHL